MVERTIARTFPVGLSLAIAQPAASAFERAGTSDPAAIVINDNRHAAGALTDGVLTLKLRAGVGTWFPEGDKGPGLRVEAFGEEAGPLQVPAPLIRVAEGTEIAASIRNDLAAPLRVHGVCARDGSACPPLEVPPSATRDIRFKAVRPARITTGQRPRACPSPSAVSATRNSQARTLSIPPAARSPIACW